MGVEASTYRFFMFTEGGMDNTTVEKNLGSI